ncbi:hypothetical protein DNA98_00095 [Meiothermus sp. Pnk-1]|nr:hypothetical protein DNA98_00095 [Meiothermus sp. Pnk-1]
MTDPQKDTYNVVDAMFDFSFRKLLLTKIVNKQTMKFIYLFVIAIIFVTQINSLVQQSRHVDPMSFFTAHLPIWFLVVMLNILLARLALELILLIVSSLSHSDPE